MGYLQHSLQIRVFDDPTAGTMWKQSVKDINGDVLCVSQFTLLADTRKGNKPDFRRAMVNLLRCSCCLPRSLTSTGLAGFGKVKGDILPLLGTHGQALQARKDQRLVNLRVRKSDLNISTMNRWEVWRDDECQPHQRGMMKFVWGNGILR